MNVTLQEIKNALGITDEFHDSTLQVYFDEAVAFLRDVGVSESKMTAGVIALGVSDLWNYGAGEGKFSEYFKMRAAQLALKR